MEFSSVKYYGLAFLRAYNRSYKSYGMLFVNIENCSVNLTIAPAFTLLGLKLNHLLRLCVVAAPLINFPAPYK